MNYHEKSVEDEFLALGYTRIHPWTTALSDESEQYYDFINNPELIETSLEDFIPYDKYPAIKTFYKLCESRVEKADKQRMIRFFCL